MAIREIIWTVSDNGKTIHPTAPQDGGVQGEHNATRAVWRVGENSVWETPTFKVYVECEDNAGNVDHTEPLQVVGGQISVLLPQAWTQYGGISTLRLVAEEEDGVVAYLVEGYARFSSRQNAGKKVDGLMKGRLAQMEAQMRGAVADATSAAETAVVAKDSAVSAAQSASISREGAQHFAEQAELAAENAASAAESASIFREGAKHFAEQAEGAAESAVSAAQEAADLKGEIERKMETGEFIASDIQAVHFTEQELTDEQKAQARENIGAGLPPLRFTVTKGGGSATSSKTYQELSDALAEGRTLICVFNGVELPLVSNHVQGLDFASDIGGVQRVVSIYSGRDVAAHAHTITNEIKIGDQTWGGDDGEWEVDFTDTINGMIGDNVSNSQRIVNARYFGAKGDGVTDDTEAIQAALHYAENNGLPLYIPAGNYLVSKTISTYTRDTDAEKQSKALNIYGSGMSTVFTTAPNFEGDFVLYIDVKGVQPRMVWVHDFAIDLTVDVSGIYFRDLGMKSVVENLWIKFVYLKKETDTTVRSAIFCDNSVVSTFERIKVQGNISGLAEKLTKNCGIVLREQTTTKIIDCDIIFCGWAIYLGGGSIGVIENCRIDENDYGVFQYTTTTDVDPAPRAYTKSPVTGEGFGSCVHNLTITKNRFEGNNCVSIFLMAYAYGDAGYLCNKGITIADNYFTGLGAGTAMWQPDRAVFRKGIRLYCCIGASIERNTFKGVPYDSTNSDSREQNYSGDAHVYDITFHGNVVVPILTGETNENGTAAAVKGNTSLPLYFCAYRGFVNNIEANQTTRQDVSLRRTMPINVTASGAVDVSKTNIWYLADGVSVDTINLESGVDASVSQEVTFVAVGTTATIKSTGRIKLAGGVDFVMGEFDTITFERVYIYPRGNFWVEKSRSVNRAT